MNDDTNSKLPDADEANLQMLSALVDHELSDAEQAVIDRKSVV